MLLWSHYADQHKGFVLEFEIDDMSLNYLAGKNILVQVVYDQPSYIGLDLWGSSAYKYKNSSWSYESEYRYIVEAGDQLHEWQSFKKGVLENLTGIIFGVRTSDSDKSALTQIIKGINQDAKFMNAELNNTGFGLRIEDTISR
jgi:hypothetical protein